MNYAQKERLRNLGYSENYIRVRDMIEKTWPQWKIDFYNNCIATAAHSMKLCPDR